MSESEDRSQISDGYHTFAELYDHRNHLFVSLMQSNPLLSWRAKHHADGTMFEGWFLAGMNLPTGTITYHLPLELWFQLNNPAITTFDVAPPWDGHTPQDVLDRLRRWTKEA